MADTNQPQTRAVDVPTLLTSIAQQLSTNEGQLNSVDGAGTHGQRVAAAFTAAASAAANANSTDAGDQLAAAAQAMRTSGKGKAASFYADGLQQAAADFKGQATISADNLLPFLQSFLGGIQSNNPAKPGQGTMLDAIQPAVNAINTASRSGQTTEKGLIDILGAAIGGTQNTAGNGTVDPGAASATNVIGGIITAVAPTLISMLFNNAGNSSQSQSSSAGGIDLGGLLGGLLNSQGAQGNASAQGGVDLGGLLGGLMGSQGAQGSASDYEGYNTQQQQQQGGSGGIDIGGLLGGLMGSQGAQGSASGGSSSGGDMGWLGGLLGGLAGGAQGNSGQSASGGGMDLGGLLGGLMGGAQNNSNQSANSGGVDLGGLLGGLMGGRSGEIPGEEDDQSRGGN